MKNLRCLRLYDLVGYGMEKWRVDMYKHGERNRSKKITINNNNMHTSSLGTINRRIYIVISNNRIHVIHSPKNFLGSAVQTWKNNHFTENTKCNFPVMVTNIYFPENKHF